MVHIAQSDRQTETLLERLLPGRAQHARRKAPKNTPHSAAQSKRERASRLQRPAAGNTAHAQHRTPSLRSHHQSRGGRFSGHYSRRRSHRVHLPGGFRPAIAGLSDSVRLRNQECVPSADDTHQGLHTNIPAESERQLVAGSHSQQAKRCAQQLAEFDDSQLES